MPIFAPSKKKRGCAPSYCITEKLKTIWKRLWKCEWKFDEASAFLCLSKSYLYKLTSGNLIPHYKPQGKMLYFEKSELEAWLRQNPVKTKGQIEQEAQKYVLNRPLKK